MKRLELLRAKLKELTEKRAEHLAAMEAATAAADADERADLNDTEKASYDEARQAITEIDEALPEVREELEELEAITARAAAAKDVPFNINGTPAGDPYDAEFRTAGNSAEVTADVKERAKRALADERSIDDSQRDKADHLLRTADPAGRFARHLVAAGRPAYREAWLKLMTEQSPVLTPDEARAVEEVRAITAGGTSGGGYLMPTFLDPTIIETSSGAINSIRMLANKVSVTGDNWQGVSSAGVTAAFGAESAVVADGSPTFAQPAIAVEKAHVFVPFTMEAGDDYPGLADDISRLVATSKDELEALKFTLGAGAGSNEPTGVVTAVVAGTTPVESAGSEAYAVGDVYAVQNGLPARHRAQASWMAALPTINLTRAFGSALGHAFLTDLAGDVPSKLLGQNLYENSSMDSTITGSGENYMLLYGDFSKYQIVDRIGLQMEFIPHLFDPTTNHPTGQRGWYARWRVGGGVLDANAFRVLNVT